MDITGILGAVTALIGSVWGIVKYYDQKRVKEQQAKETKENTRDETLKGLSNAIGNLNTTMNKQHDEVVQLRSEISHVKEKLEEVDDKLIDTQRTMDENEMDRLRSDIINCANKIEEGFSISEAVLQHIHHCYDKYAAKGGNSYIEECMDFVREYERECREIGAFMNLDN